MSNYFENFDARLDLDNFIKRVSRSCPLNNDDCFIVMRGKISTSEMFTSVVGTTVNVGFVLLNAALQNDGMRDVILGVADAIQIEKSKTNVKYQTKQSKP